MASVTPSGTPNDLFTMSAPSDPTTVLPKISDARESGAGPGTARGAAVEGGLATDAVPGASRLTKEDPADHPARLARPGIH